MWQVLSLNRLNNQHEEEDEEDFSALDEPLPECTLAFTHRIGNQVDEVIKAACYLFHNCSQNCRINYHCLIAILRDLT